MSSNFQGFLQAPIYDGCHVGQCAKNRVRSTHSAPASRRNQGATGYTSPISLRSDKTGGRLADATSACTRADEVSELSNSIFGALSFAGRARSFAAFGIGEGLDTATLVMPSMALGCLRLIGAHGYCSPASVPQ